MILITGYKGFIGKKLYEYLKNTEKVYGIDIENNDISKINWNNITKIYHQGAISNTLEKDINKIFQYNIEYSIKLFEKAIEYNIPVYYASSASIYGNSNDYTYNPLNYYALSKLTIDLWVLDNIHKFKNIVGFRYFNVYGLNENKSYNTMSPISKFLYQAINQNKIILFNNSNNYFRDFVCINDVIQIITKEYDSGIYDLGTSNPISFYDVANIVSQKYKVPIEYIDMPDELVNQYQKYSCAQKHFPKYEFITVKNYLK